MVDSNGIIERLLRANEKQAEGTGALVEIQKQNNRRLEEIEIISRKQEHLLGQMTNSLQRMDEQREDAVKEIKDHVSEAIIGGLRASEMWWRRAFWIGVGLIALSNLINVGIDQLMKYLNLMGP